VTSPVHAAFVGARKHTNNTAELSALAELFHSLLYTTTSRLTRGGPNGQRVRDGVCDGETLPGGERTTSELSSSSVAALGVEARSDMETRQGRTVVISGTTTYVDKQADLGRSGARDCGAPEWQDESIPTDADDARRGDQRRERRRGY